jgi:hypothetical protein
MAYQTQIQNIQALYAQNQQKYKLPTAEATASDAEPQDSDELPLNDAAKKFCFTEALWISATATQLAKVELPKGFQSKQRYVCGPDNDLVTPYMHGVYFDMLQIVQPTTVKQLASTKFWSAVTYSGHQVLTIDPDTLHRFWREHSPFDQIIKGI